jgi:ubiquinone/menaquinone biosynthesis C-methylase UbiE
VSQVLADSRLGLLIIRALGAAMESRFRYRFLGPASILLGADIQPGQTVLEVGCGTGFFTLPVAKLIGPGGRLVALDVLPGAVELVSQKVGAAGLTNVRLVVGDALSTGLDAESIDVVLLFGVIPAPMLPLRRLLPEMHRVLRPGGTLAVWPAIPLWLPQSILRSGLFAYCGKRSGVHKFRR